MSRNRANQKQYPKEAPLSFYLGKGEEKKRRVARLKEYVEKYGEDKLSVLMKKIGDGELVIKEPDTAA
jgi:hypothetical protein